MKTLIFAIVAMASIAASAYTRAVVCSDSGAGENSVDTGCREVIVARESSNGTFGFCEVGNSYGENSAYVPCEIKSQPNGGWKVVTPEVPTLD